MSCGGGEWIGPRPDGGWRLERGRPSFGFRSVLMRPEATADVLPGKHQAFVLDCMVESIHYWYWYCSDARGGRHGVAPRSSALPPPPKAHGAKIQETKTIFPPNSLQEGLRRSGTRILFQYCRVNFTQFRVIDRRVDGITDIAPSILKITVTKSIGVIALRTTRGSEHSYNRSSYSE